MASNSMAERVERIRGGVERDPRVVGQRIARLDAVPSPEWWTGFHRGRDDRSGFTPRDVTWHGDSIRFPSNSDSVEENIALIDGWIRAANDWCLEKQKGRDRDRAALDETRRTGDAQLREWQSKADEDRDRFRNL